MLQLIFNTDFFFSILRITAPILFATLGAVVGEKAAFPTSVLRAP